MVASVDLIAATGKCRRRPSQNSLQPASVRLPPPAERRAGNDDGMIVPHHPERRLPGHRRHRDLAALGFGWQNVTNLISGGVVPAAGPGAVALGLFGVVFTSFCAIGQALTPLYLDIVNGGFPPQPAARHATASAAAGADFTVDAHPYPLDSRQSVAVTCRPTDAV